MWTYYNDTIWILKIRRIMFNDCSKAIFKCLYFRMITFSHCCQTPLLNKYKPYPVWRCMYPQFRGRLVLLREKRNKYPKVAHANTSVVSATRVANQERNPDRGRASFTPQSTASCEPLYDEGPPQHRQLLHSKILPTTSIYKTLFISAPPYVRHHGEFITPE